MATANFTSGPTITQINSNGFVVSMATDQSWEAYAVRLGANSGAPPWPPQSIKEGISTSDDPALEHISKLDVVANVPFELTFSTANPETAYDLRFAIVDPLGTGTEAVAVIQDDIAVTAAAGGGNVSLPSNNLSSSGTLESPAVTSQIVVSVDDLTSSGSLDSPGVTGNISTPVNSLASTALLDEPALSITVNPGVDDLVSGGALDSPALSVHVNAEVDNLTSAGSLDTPAVTGNSSVAVDSLASSGNLDSPVLTVHTSTQVDDLVSSGTLDQPDVAAHGSVQVDDLVSSGTLDSPAITGNILLAVDDLTSSGVLDTPDVQPTVSIAVNDLTSNGNLDSPDVTIAAPALVDLDLDNTVNAGQTGVVIHLSNVAANVSSWDADIDGNALTPVNWVGDGTAIVDVPANFPGIAGSGVLTVKYVAA